MPTTGTVHRGMSAPPEVLSYFRDKALAPRFSWQDIWGEEHAHAFTVAGVVEARVLDEFKAAIDKAITEGWGFTKFRDELQRRLSPLGWWGPREVSDPEARWRPKTVDFTAPGRLQTTFWSNMRTAFAAGQWDRAQRTKQTRPYLLYVRSVAERKRPEHLRWVGTILPVDDGFWATHFPPNGWGCKCSVRQVSEAERDGYLGRPPSDDPNAIRYTDEPPPVETRTWVNRRTGERVQVPVGIDPGWQTNPGFARGRRLGTILAEQLDATPQELARGRIARLVGSDGFEAFLARADARTAFTGDIMPVARVADDAAARLGVAPTVTLADAAAVTYPPETWPGLQEAIDGAGLARIRDDRFAVSVGRRRVVLMPADGRLTVEPRTRSSTRRTAGPGPVPAAPAREWPWEPIAGRSDARVAISGPAVETGRDLALWSDADDARNLVRRMLAGAPATVPIDATVESGKRRLMLTARSPSREVTIVRSFYEDENGRLAVVHDLFTLDAAHQGGGHARAMMRASIEEYVARGVARIEVHANIDVGGYSWARLGFRLAHPETARRHLADRLIWEVEMVPDDRAILREIIDRAPDADLMYDLARATSPDGRRIGREFLLGSDWFGEIDLTDPAQLARLKEALK